MKNPSLPANAASVPRRAVAAAAPLSLLLALPLTAAPAAGEEEVFSTRTIRQTMTVAAGAPCRLVVDNVWGDVEVDGGTGRAVAVTAIETVRAETAAAAQRAASEVALEITERDGAIDLFVDGPFRHPSDRGRWADRHRDPGYTVVYDLAIAVPRDCDLDLRTVNEGRVEVVGVAGSVEARNVNGGIRLERVAVRGGEIRTVNGAIEGRFAASPERRLKLATVNGRIEATFPPRLAADLILHSTWGEMWSEFDLTPLPVPPPTRRRRDGRLIIEAGHGAALRAGAGGPEIHFETLNGDIFIRKES